MILLDKKKDWASAKKEMKATDAFLNKLKTFDVATVSEAKLKKVRNEYLSQENFNPNYIAVKS